MNAPKPVSPRARMQALLAIPDSQRSDAEWDELNELEIMFAPGNRLGTPDRSGPAERNGGGQQQRRRGGGGGGGQRPQGAAGGNMAAGGNSAAPGNGPSGGDAGAKKPARKFRKKTPRAKDKPPVA